MNAQKLLDLIIGQGGILLFFYIAKGKANNWYADMRIFVSMRHRESEKTRSFIQFIPLRKKRTEI